MGKEKILFCLVSFMILVLAFGVSFAQEENQNKDLVIPLEKITKDAYFVPTEVDGTKMEIIAVRDSKGEVRTAFNTCQVCNGSERAYYKQEGNFLVCQNCGNRFSMDRVGVSAGGCNPYPIFENQRTIADDKLIIPYELLKEAKEIFSTWKVDYD